VSTTTDRRDSTAVAAVPTARAAADDRSDGPGVAVVASARGWVDRVRERRGVEVTGVGAVLLGVAVMMPGVLADYWGSGTFGGGSAVTFVLASGIAAAAVRRSALLTVTLLPPLLFAAGVTALALAGGQTDGNRELVLEVATTLALSAPALFLGTALALAVVLGRLTAGVARR
jgi:hypothetical protein